MVFIKEIFINQNEAFYKKLHFYFEPQIFKKGEKIITSDSSPNGFYVIYKGLVSLKKKIDIKNSISLEKSLEYPKTNYFFQKVVVLKQNDTFGEYEILFNKKSEYDYIAESNIVKIEKMSVKQFKNHLFDKPYYRENAKKFAERKHERYKSRLDHSIKNRISFLARPKNIYSKSKKRNLNPMNKQKIDKIKDLISYSQNKFDGLSYIDKINFSLKKISKKKNVLKKKYKSQSCFQPIEIKLASAGYHLINHYKQKQSFSKYLGMSPSDSKIRSFDQIKESLDNIYHKTGIHIQKSFKIEKDLSNIKSRKEFERDMIKKNKNQMNGKIDKQSDKLRKLLYRQRINQRDKMDKKRAESRYKLSQIMQNSGKNNNIFHIKPEIRVKSLSKIKLSGFHKQSGYFDIK